VCLALVEPGLVMDSDGIGFEVAGTLHSSSPSGGGLNGGQVAGIVIGVLVIVGALGGVATYLYLPVYRRRRANSLERRPLFENERRETEDFI
jgi:hypothetical protein